jgi:hypothetical protein
MHVWPEADMENPQEKVIPEIVTHRIGIVLAGLRDANVNALRFLVLHMNRLQRTFEFEFLYASEDKFLETLEAYESDIPKKPLDLDSARQEASAFGKRYRVFLEGENIHWKIVQPPPDYFIVISLARLEDNYYVARRWPVSVLALGDWKTEMAPPSILEFVLTLVLREAVASISRNLGRSQHLGTKGCLCDFTSRPDEVRLKVLGAFLCAHCSNILISEGHLLVPDEVRRVLDKSWLGKLDEPGSPAAIAAKLDYNLFVTKGLKPTTWERALATLQEEGFKELIKVALGILAAAVLVWLGLKGAG